MFYGTKIIERLAFIFHSAEETIHKIIYEKRIKKYGTGKKYDECNSKNLSARETSIEPNKIHSELNQFHVPIFRRVFPLIISSAFARILFNQHTHTHTHTFTFARNVSAIVSYIFSSLIWQLRSKKTTPLSVFNQRFCSTCTQINSENRPILSEWIWYWCVVLFVYVWPRRKEQKRHQMPNSRTR